MSALRRAPGALLGVSLDAARWPLDLAARATGQAGNDTWGPARRFEGVRAGVETTVGAALGDPALVSKGRLRREKLDELARAAALEVVAEQERRAADREFQQRRQRAEGKRSQVEQATRAQEKRVEQQARQRERAAQSRAARKKAAARDTQATAQDAISDEQRRVRLAELAEESQALHASEQALDAAQTVELIDETLERTREERRNR